MCVSYLIESSSLPSEEQWVGLEFHFTDKGIGAPKG